MTDTTFEGNETIDDGGAIANSGTLLVQGGSMARNSAGGLGGAVANVDGGTVTLRRVPITANHAGSGGAIASVEAETRVEFLTLERNTASENAGAVLAEGGTFAIAHCTLTGNSAALAGGAIVAASTFTLRHCTVIGNTATLLSGGGVDVAAGVFTLENSIVTGNHAPSAPASADLDAALLATLSVVSANLAQALQNEGTTTGTGTISPAAPLLAPLGDYGGATRTMPPLPGSPAIDAAVASTETLDQRGFPRPMDGDAIVGTVRDIGAVEFNPAFDLATFWALDWDGDGQAFGLERALGTDFFVSDTTAPGNLTAPAFNVSGDAELTFGLNPAVARHTIWILQRSTTLLPGSFVEIYRYDGPSQIETLQSGIESDFLPPLAPTAIRVTDQTPPAGKAFYRFVAQLVP